MATINSYTEMKAHLREKAEWCKGARIPGWEKYDDLSNRLLQISTLMHNWHFSGIWTEKQLAQRLKWMFTYFKKQWQGIGAPVAELEQSYALTWALMKKPA